jgi:DNA segregation ATPase FtsK/SpoIIIE, S-DNA-T family
MTAEAGTEMEHVAEVVDDADVEITEDQPRPVDQPDVLADTGGWLERHRAQHADAAPVIPAYLRNSGEFSDAARFVAAHFAHLAAFHATRSPIYLLRLVARGPRGMGRGLAWWGRWVVDAEGHAAEVRAAAAGDNGQWLSLSKEHTRRVKPRAITSAVVGAPLAAALVWAVVALPVWAIAPALAGVLALFGLAGRRPDRPILSQYTTGHTTLQRPLDAEEVTAALAAIGIKGKPTFVNPIQTDGPGWRAELDLPPGFLAEKVLEERAKLAAAMRRPLTTVWPEGDRDAHPGRLVLWVAKKDPARSARRIWPLMADGRTDLFEDFPFGFDPRGRVIPLNLMYSNLLMGGVPGSGKTSGVLVTALAGALDPRCEMWVYEMKGSGDLDPVQPVCHRYVSGDDDEHCESGLDALRALEKELKRRKEVIAALPPEQVPKGRKVYPHLADKHGLHPLLAIFDEAHTLFEHEEFGAEAADIAGRLVRKARAYGIILVITTQRPDAKSLPKVISDNVSTRFCLAVTGQQANDMVLGTSMYKNGVRATMFDPKKEAGTGWLAKSSHDTQIVRAAFIEQAEAIEVGRRALAMRTAAGTLSGMAAGEEPETVDTTTIIDHVLAVWPGGEEAAHSARLIEALAAYRPEQYGPWLDITDEKARAAQLATALKPHKVPTRQVKLEGVNRRGVALEALARHLQSS